MLDRLVLVAQAALQDQGSDRQRILVALGPVKPLAGAAAGAGVALALKVPAVTAGKLQTLRTAALVAAARAAAALELLAQMAQLPLVRTVARAETMLPGQEAVRVARLRRLARMEQWAAAVVAAGHLPAIHLRSIWAAMVPMAPITQQLLEVLTDLAAAAAVVVAIRLIRQILQTRLAEVAERAAVAVAVQSALVASHWPAAMVGLA